MKDMKIRLRLNTALALLVLLLLIGVAAAMWILQVRWDTQHESDTLDSAKQLIDLRITSMSDAVRGVLLNPKDDYARGLWKTAMTNMFGSMTEFEKQFANQPKMARVVDSVERLEKSVSNKRQDFSEVVAMAET